jgi:hypothetical protein
MTIVRHDDVARFAATGGIHDHMTGDEKTCTATPPPLVHAHERIRRCPSLRIAEDLAHCSLGDAVGKRDTGGKREGTCEQRGCHAPDNIPIVIILEGQNILFDIFLSGASAIHLGE